MTTTEVFLGLIALAVLAMAAGQVAAVVMAMRAVRRVGETLNRLEQDVRPIVMNAQTVSAEAVRAAALASAQVERADRVLGDAARRLEEAMAVVQRTVLAPAHSGVAIFQGIKAAFAALRSPKSRPRTRPTHMGPVPRAVPDPGDDDHASFIG